MRSTELWSPAIAVMCLALGAVPALAQEQRPRFEVRTQAVRVKVWALDTDGDHVAGITTDDLIVRVDGERRPVVDLHHVQTSQQAERTRTLPTVIDDTPPQSQATLPVPGARYWLALDLVTRSPNALVKAGAIRASREFLTLLSENDRVGLMVRAPRLGFRPLVELTDEHSRVTEALDELDRSQVGLRHGQSGGGMYMALGLLSRRLGQRESSGRTDVLFFSRGDADGLLGMPGYLELLDDRVTQLTEAGIVVHTLNPESLPAFEARKLSETGLPASGSAQRSRDGGDRPVHEKTRVVKPWFPSPLANRGPLRVVATGTGGVEGFYRHALPKAFAAVVASRNSYYELTFSVATETRGVIDVSVETRIPGVRAVWWPRTIAIDGDHP